ncbi:MAG: cytochrome B [Rhodospirillaceae bacterium]|nr:cytochrome B [Rhodospirillaceae bacterium]|tara:strand:+ start:65 stop:646 length:582 start_codon:yes stop_codon:yes gene_type:complete
MLRRLYDWTMNLAAHPHAIWWLAGLTAAESIFFPIPPDILIIPMILAAREKTWRIVAIVTTASVVGGAIGYGIGYFFYEGVGKPIIEFYGYGAKYDVFQSWYQEFGAWIVGAGGFTPIPYKVITIASGVAQLDIVTFMVVSFLSRGARFLIVAALLWKFGEPIRNFIEARLGLLTGLFFGLLLAGFLAVKLLA